jgi:hypothetical protein
VGAFSIKAGEKAINPKEFDWAEDQQVTVTNPTSDTYKFKVHSKDYEVGSGETVRMPGYIAWVYVYGLSSQLCQAAGEFNRWNEEGFKQTYYQRLVVGADDVIQQIVKQPSVEKVETEETPEGETEEPESKPTTEPKNVRTRNNR